MYYFLTTGTSPQDAQTYWAGRDQVLLALIGVGATLVGILGVTMKNLQHSRAANKAVNDVDAGEMRIYEKVTRIDEAVMRLDAANSALEERGWLHGLPEDLATAPAFTQTIRDIQQKADTLQQNQVDIIERVNHVDLILTEHIRVVQAEMLHRKRN